ncbi:hypothetical protein [Methylomonas sp. AM2-LC]|uniref:hypothetical protein n=1 Tax=Methylomonas sp. AM2-LC TaxID=3153301 RepID=UPI0032667029
MIEVHKFLKKQTGHSPTNSILSAIVSHLINYDSDCLVDLAGTKVKYEWFQDIVLPLIAEFGGNVISQRLKFINLTDELDNEYRFGMQNIDSYFERRKNLASPNCGDISDITFEHLIKCREVSRRDPIMALAMFGISDEMLSTYQLMDIDTIKRISSAGIICFKPTFTDEYLSRISALNSSEIDVFLNLSAHIDMQGLYEQS